MTHDAGSRQGCIKLSHCWRSSLRLLVENIQGTTWEHPGNNNGGRVSGVKSDAGLTL